MIPVSLPTFIVTQNSRYLKRKILKEFLGRDEFDLSLVEVSENEVEANFFNIIKGIVKKALDLNTGLVVVCKNEHRFTDAYSREILFHYIKEAERLDADILLGGAEWVSSLIEAAPGIYWSELFTGSKFIIIFRRFFTTIACAALESDIQEIIKLSTLSKKGFFIYPFISQKDKTFYTGGNQNFSAEKLDFHYKPPAVISLLEAVRCFYTGRMGDLSIPVEFKDAVIPTYIINLKKRTNRLEHIKKQFKGRSEFEIKIIEAHKHKIGNVGLWLSICEIIKLAMSNNDDVILICEDDHQFTSAYSKDIFFKNIFQASHFGVGILLGGIAHFGNAVQVSEDMFWINSFYCTQFTVIYKHMFQRILDEPFEDDFTVDGAMSIITSNKLVMFPFISTQKFFGESDISERNNTPGVLNKQFSSTFERMKKIKMAGLKFNIKPGI